MKHLLRVFAKLRLRLRIRWLRRHIGSADYQRSLAMRDELLRSTRRLNMLRGWM